jgi:hypothetical protein
MGDMEDEWAIMLGLEVEGARTNVWEVGRGKEGVQQGGE